MEETVWKRIAVLIVISSLPVSALAHTKLFYRMSCRSDYRKVEVVTPEPTVTAEPAEPTVEPTVEPTATPLVEIPLESTLTPEPTLTPIPTETPTEVPTPILVVEIIDSEGAEEPSDQISTPSDLATTQKFPPTVLRQWMS